MGFQRTILRLASILPMLFKFECILVLLRTEVLFTRHVRLPWVQRNSLLSWSTIRVIEFAIRLDHFTDYCMINKSIIIWKSFCFFLAARTNVKALSKPQSRHIRIRLKKVSLITIEWRSPNSRRERIIYPQCRIPNGIFKLQGCHHQNYEDNG